MKRIPIPSSFSTSSTAAVDNHVTKKCRIAINEQWLVKLEIALQIYFLQTKSLSISYAQLCTLVPKLELERDNSDSLLPETSERLWHDFVCVVTPILYTFDDQKLQIVTIGGNRQYELRMLIRQAQTEGVSESLSSAIINTFVQEKKEVLEIQQRHQQQQSSARDTTGTSSATLRTYINGLPKQHSTLEELEARIRAKSQERLRHLKRAEEQGPRDDKVWVADAIFSFTRKLLRQRPGGRFRTASLPSVQTSKCRVTVTNLLPAVPGYSFEQFVTILQDIVKVCPTWISWKDDTISKTTIMTIETAIYKSVRIQLMGETKVDGDRTPQQQGPTRHVPVVTLSGNKRQAKPWLS